MKRGLTSKLFIPALIYALALTQAAAQSRTSYAVSGQVLNDAGRGAPGMRVCAYSLDSNERGVLCTRTGADGRFTIRLEVAGRYGLIPDDAADGYVPQYLPFWRNPFTPQAEVTVDDQNPGPSVSVALGPKNGVLNGVSVDAATNLPVENVQYVMCHADRPQVCFRGSVKNAEGKFRVSAPHVPFTLKFTADGFEDWLSAEQRGGAAIRVASGTAVEINVFLTRRKEAAGKAISEAEKQQGVNLAAPAQLSPADGAVFEHFPRATKLEWSPVEGAVSYAVEVDYCRGGERSARECVDPQPHRLKSDPPQSGIAGTTYELNFVGAQPGRWRVWAVDAEGREGFKSPWRTFFYLK